MPHRMDDAEDAVAILDPVVRDDAADADDVVDLFECPLLLPHLAVDRIDVLRPPGQLDLDPFGQDRVLQVLHDPGDVASLVAPTRLQAVS